MRKKVVTKTGVLLSMLLMSCAIITVNIYFPEKEVKEAYEALEKELMIPGEIKPEGTPEEKPANSPQSSIRFEWVVSAHAQESSLLQDSEVVKDAGRRGGYREMGTTFRHRSIERAAPSERKEWAAAVRESY
jgi:hypothetical protein